MTEQFDNQPEHPTPRKEHKEKGKGLNPFSLMFIIVIAVAILTYLVPAGEFDREDIDGRTVVIPNTFKYIDAEPLGFYDILTSFHNGLIAGAPIIFTIFLFGGAVGIMKRTGALESLVKVLVILFKDFSIVLIPVLVLFFGLLGTFIGLAEETLIYIPIIIPIMIALRYDALTAVGVVFLGALAVGFTSAITNPYTVGVAQSVAELPNGTGWEYRIPIFIVFYIVVTLYLMNHARRVKKNPELAENGSYTEDDIPEIDWNYKLSKRHLVALIVFAIGILTIVIGVIQFGFYLEQIGATILVTGILMGIICGLNMNQIGNGFVKGAKDILTGALIVGFALAIVEVMEQGQMLDVILNFASGTLEVLPTEFAAVGMFLTQLVLNLLVPSGSGQAALTMPIMAPLSDLVGVTRQTAVVAFQLGDGLSNIIIPTSGILLASLSIAGIPYGKWLRWVTPLFLILVTIGIIFVAVAQMIKLGPF